MRFVVLIRTPRDSFDAWRSMSPEERARGAERHREWAARYSAAGMLVASAELAPAEDAQVLRKENGKVVMTGGPFAESREVLGGLFIVEATDGAAAQRIAAEWPGIDAPGTTLELVPVVDTVSR